MKLILLPGLSEKNKEWIEQMESIFGRHFDTTEINYYDHWTQGGGMKLKIERDKISKMVSVPDDHAVLAKSAGVFLAMDGVKKKILNPKFCIFFGTTTKSTRELEGWDVSTLFTQEINDPFLSFSDLNESITKAELESAEVVEIPGRKHWYDQVEKFENKVNKYIVKQVK